MSVRIWIPVVAALSAGTFGAVKQDEAAVLEARVAELEDQMVEVQEYLQAQAKATLAMDTTFDQSEVAGFTWGINPESREILLKGFRAYTANVRKNVPGAPADAKKDEKATATTRVESAGAKN